MSCQFITELPILNTYYQNTDCSKLCCSCIPWSQQLSPIKGSVLCCNAPLHYYAVYVCLHFIPKSDGTLGGATAFSLHQIRISDHLTWDSHTPRNTAVPQLHEHISKSTNINLLAYIQITDTADSNGFCRECQGSKLVLFLIIIYNFQLCSIETYSVS